MAKRTNGTRIAALLSAFLIVGLLVGLTSSASAGTGGPTASAAKCKKNKKGKCIKKKKKKKKPVAPPAVPPGALTVGPASFAFPNTQHGAECLTLADGDCPDQAFTVTNTGASTSGVPSASIAMVSNGNVPVPDNRAGFKIIPSANTCTAALAPGASCSVTVTFSPESQGTFSGTLNVTAAPATAGSASLTGSSTS